MNGQSKNRIKTQAKHKNILLVLHSDNAAYEHQLEMRRRASSKMANNCQRLVRLDNQTNVTGENFRKTVLV